MKRFYIRLLYVVLLALGVGLSPVGSAYSDNSIGKRLEGEFYSVKKYGPDEEVMRHLEVENMNRDPAFLIEDKEKISVINFWAPWCSGCVTELPTLKRFQDKHPDVRVIYVAETRSGFQAVKKMADEMGLPTEYSFYDGRSYIKRWLNTSVYPTTVVVSPKGEILYRFEGDTDWSAPLMSDMIKSLSK